MSRIANAFASNKAFIGFVTGGDPSIEKSAEFIRAMVNAGVDLVEIGIPFSDPIAEGKVIQEANIRALNAGATIEKLFGLVESLRDEGGGVSLNIPLVFLTYLNPVFHYGYERFFARCQRSGIDGIIIPDLPFEEQGELRDIATANGVDLISLIAPTSEERIATIARNAKGFLYIVSSMGVTGERGEIKTDLASIIASVRAHTALPVAVGFGIHTPEQATDIARLADGVIVGSAIVKLILEHGDKAAVPVACYVSTMKAAVHT
ncbi:MAG: tryptophan synthase subunit alpha [Treponema sp.]|jgi:tryptophan synthase alpha chain|nr:tryptophan synthase subunit alpha [Treponema sp.]